MSDSFAPVFVKDAVPGTLVKDKRVLRNLVTEDGSYPQLRVVLEDLTTATESSQTLIQHSAIRWSGYANEPKNQWDIDNAAPRPERCPGCRVKRVSFWIFREGGMKTTSTGGDSYETYNSGVWECTNCGHQTLPNVVHSHPSNT
jgi:hypothetical protein